MFYALLADTVVFLHFLWIIFLIFGAFIGRRHKWLKMIHIGGLCFALVLQVFGWYCPLTYLEVWLRRMYDPLQSYDGSFIINYVEKLIYLELSVSALLIMTILLLVMSVWIYLYKPRPSRT